ncbi:MAG: DUF2863 family protein [Pseudomonadota bacterium]
MKRNRLSSRKRISADAQELGRLAAGLAEAGGRLEAAFWRKQLDACVNKMLSNEAEEDLNIALDRLADAEAAAYGDLADSVESCAESCVMTHQGHEFDVLLVNVPLLVWSRFSIPVGLIPERVLETLKVQLMAHVFAQDARLTLVDYLYSPDQLPRSFVETAKFMQTLGRVALGMETLKLDIAAMPETNPFLSDARYLLGAVAVPRGSPVFRWNEGDQARAEVLKEWLKQGTPCFEPLLTGCAYQPLLADAYHAACRASDLASRPYSVRASIAFLQTSLGQSSANLRAVIGGFYEKRLEEYRVSFGPRDDETVFHGVVWPLLGGEDESTEVIAEIEALLREVGIKEVLVLNQQFPFEFCDDCGAPLYPNLEGDLVHPELPEQASNSSQALH